MNLERSTEMPTLTAPLAVTEVEDTDTRFCCRLFLVCHSVALVKVIRLINKLSKIHTVLVSAFQ
jgi:hypothetical protein